MDSILASQIESIAGLQSVSGLAPLMKALSFLGSEQFFLLLLPLYYFCIHPRIGMRLGLILIAGATLNLLLKIAFAQPRPYWIDPRVRPLGIEGSYGIPSGHAQNAVSVWGYLSSVERKPWAWISAGTLILLISLSRAYLGVHFWTDLIVGWIIGLVFLLAFLRYEPVLEAWFERQPFPRQLLATTLVAAALFLIGLSLRLLHLESRPAWLSHAQEGRSLDTLASYVGALWGLGIGWAKATDLKGGVSFSAGGPFSRRFLRLLVGMVGVILFWRGLALLSLPEGAPALLLRFARYALTTFWVAYLAPLLFLRMGLAEPAPDLSPRAD